MVWVIYNSGGEVVAVTTSDTTKEMMLIERPDWSAEEVPFL